MYYYLDILQALLAYYDTEQERDALRLRWVKALEANRIERKTK